MKERNLFANVAKAAFALAVIMAMPLTFAACSSDGKDPTPACTNTVTIDGVEKPVLSATIEEYYLRRNIYSIRLYLSADEKEKATFSINGALHGGKTIDLTKKESEKTEWYWYIDSFDANDKTLFIAFGGPDDRFVVFQDGTLYVKRIGETTEFEIKLKNGKVMDPSFGDGYAHSISISYKGTLAFEKIR